MTSRDAATLAMFQQAESNFENLRWVWIDEFVTCLLTSCLAVADIGSSEVYLTPVAVLPLRQADEAVPHLKIDEI